MSVANIKTTKLDLVYDEKLGNLPALYLNVYVEGPVPEYYGLPELLLRASCYRAPTLDVADVVIFTGGADVSPSLYGEEAHLTVFSDKERDEECVKLYKEAVDKGIPMVGICRGAQFIHVMRGGKLYQDVDGHNSSHLITDGKNKIWSSSVHHQMVIPQEGMEIVAWSDPPKSTSRWLNPKTSIMSDAIEVEAFYYDDIVAFGTQGHPEYANVQGYTEWFIEKLEQYICNNPKVGIVKQKKGANLYRLTSKGGVRVVKDERKD